MNIEKVFLKSSYAISNNVKNAAQNFKHNKRIEVIMK